MKNLRRWITRTVFLILLPVTGIAVGVFYYATGGRHVSTENAYVRADVIAISSEIDGRVTRVMVDDNQTVEAGQILFEIDPEPFELELATANTELAMVGQEVESLRAQYGESQAEIRTARERVRYLKLEHDRQSDLMEKGHGVRARLEEAEHELKTARRQVETLRQRRQMVVAELGGNPDLPLEEHPRYLWAQVKRDKAALDLKRTIVRAPVSGTLGNVTLEVGEQIETGDSLFPLIASGDQWIEANLKEVHLTYVEVGQAATVRIDSYPDHEWLAWIESISPATGAEFALLPAQNATGNWVKVVQRVPVKLRLDQGQHLPALRAGMTATVEIDTGHERPLGVRIKQVMAEYGLGGLARGLARIAGHDG